ncbi:tRNA pseudouridine(55) synthase TruB, partial [Haemophilus influenzae]|nr:tRNA pseudouridine(55) synthase TruB [Haemophilus influenzae]MCK9050242.1 tRNA pseudouridine(55) synthase TruB [Haemophilus influenzae]
LSELDRLLLPTDTAVSKLPALHLDAEQSKAIGFGQRVKFANEQQLSELDRLLLPTDTAVSKLPALHLDAEQSKAIGFGQRVKFANE